MSQQTLRGHRPSQIDDTPIPMVLAHASGLDASAFYPLTKALAPRTCICPEYIGYPHGGPLPEKPVLEADAETIEAAIRKIDRPVHLFGHSYGGRVALEVARRQEVALETLILFEPVVQGALAPREMHDVLDISNGYEPFLCALTDYWGGPGTWNALSSSFKAQQLRRAARIHAEVTTLAADRIPPSAWQDCLTPTLVIRGEYNHHDAETMCSAVSDAITASTLTVIPTGAHMAPVVDAKTVGVIIKTWLGLR